MGGEREARVEEEDMLAVRWEEFCVTAGRRWGWVGVEVADDATLDRLDMRVMDEARGVARMWRGSCGA